MTKQKPNVKKSKKKTGDSGKTRSVPLALSRTVSVKMPKVTNRPTGCVVKHREFVWSQPGATLFQLWSLPINPAMPSSFPWLHSVARNYEAYCFRKLRFIYEPMVGAVTDGLVIMAVDYDASDPAPALEHHMCAYDGAITAPVYEHVTLECPPSRMKALSGRLFTRIGALAANQDIKTYDVGNLFVAVVGTDTAARKGTLWVEYEVELFTPGAPSMSEEAEDSAKLIGGGGNITKLRPFGDAPAITQGIDLPLNSAAGDTITFAEPGEYVLRTSLQGTGLTGGPPAFGGTVNTVTRTDGIANAAGTVAWDSIFVKVTQALQTLIVSYELVGTTVSALGMYISPHKYSLR